MQKITYRGITYRTATELCNAYGVDRTTFCKRIKRGATLDEALKPIEIMDHAGNRFQSIKAMLKFYNIERGTFYARLHADWSLEDALTVPTAKSLRKIDGKRKFVRMKVPFKKIRCKDHIGNHFKSKQAMCQFWGISAQTYFARIKKGWSLEKSLTESVRGWNRT